MLELIGVILLWAAVFGVAAVIAYFLVRISDGRID